MEVRIVVQCMCAKQDGEDADELITPQEVLTRRGHANADHQENQHARKMAAINLVNTLRAKTRAMDEDDTYDDDYAWGTYKVLRGINTKRLTRQELKNHLQARDLSIAGNKTQLAERLQASVLEEQVKSYADAEDSEFQLGADLEERGAVYVAGENSSGQLGQGDLALRDRFVVIPETRGAGVCYVAAGHDISFAVTEDHDVLSWGGGGMGATGHRLAIDYYDDDPQGYLAPKPIRDLVGEDISQVQTGASHCLATSKGGDLYVWGRGSCGQLGLGDLESKQIPTLYSGLPHGTHVTQVAVGENHSLALTRTGELYSWGHGDRGRLGLGVSRRSGVVDSERFFFPSPMLLHTLSKDSVRQVSCGPSFCLAITPSGTWSWGAGEGYVLGHGDTAKRECPTPISALASSVVLQVECGVWHCAAVVLVPPCRNGGYLYTWGSGYHGQLALGSRQVQPTPAIVSKLLVSQQFVRQVWCGSHHCAAVTIDGELYTWGSNRTGCLGRSTRGGDPNYSPDPGHVGGFGVLVDGIGRGLPRAVACGREFTLVATYPYEGPVMEMATRMMEASAIEEDGRYLQEAEEHWQNTQNIQQGKESALEGEAAGSKLGGQRKVNRPCSLCEPCEGFLRDSVRESICARCHHSISFHAKANSEGNRADCAAAEALSKY